MQITKLEYQKRNPNRVNVYVDGKFAVGLDVNSVISLGLCKNQPLTGDGLARIISESDYGKLLGAAVNFLSFRPRSEWEVKHFLEQKTKKLQSASPEKESLTESVLKKLKQTGHINDGEFVRWFADQRQTFRPKGHRAVEVELRRKGVDIELIRHVLAAQSVGALSQYALAEKALEKPLRRLAKSAYLPSEVFRTKGKLQRFLANRGFDYDTAREAVENAVKKRYTNPASQDWPLE